MPSKVVQLNDGEPSDPVEESFLPLEDFLPYLELRFSDIPPTSSGLVFGRDRNTCDIVLPNISGISRRHFALTYDNNFDDGHYRLIVRDLSTYGTMVTYNHEGHKLGTKCDWVIGGSEVADGATIIVRPHDDLRFRIVVTRRDITSPAYIRHVERWCRGLGASGAEAPGGLS
ncbi:hypothetical protein C8A01DRAFT_17631 [Parachaetomium inaequale]|uniref:FHA domain-containing protein n=1 Tax=Parachaetomium inaequale TaxID=2588326 RepID=A0AAN6PC67_9PEZI|nr:hypothetical protein C8A01DRAFT_17631 [Parachaetomium inaequale]